MNKNDNVKIEIRKKILQLIRKEYDNIEVGEYQSDEIDVVLTELKEIAEMIRDKDKLLKQNKKAEQSKNNNLNKYFNMDR